MSENRGWSEELHAAWNSGYVAYRQNVFSKNPHPPFTQVGKWWQKGWDVAKKERDLEPKRT